MAKIFSEIKYQKLDARQKENYNFQKASGVLADYGFNTIRLSADWNGADFLAQHITGEPVLRIQLKSRVSFAKKYIGKDLWICFCAQNGVYLFPHDRILNLFLESGRVIGDTVAWDQLGIFNFPDIAQWMLPIFEDYLLLPKRLLSE